MREAIQARASGARAGSTSKSTVWPILDDHEINAHSICCHMKTRHPRFDGKMPVGLMVYRDVSLYTAKALPMMHA